MVVNSNIERRHIVINGQSTTVSLEPLYWLFIENLANGEWRPWTHDCLADKPSDVGRASWLRQSVLMVMADG